MSPQPVSFSQLTRDLTPSPRMPVVFLGHGSPMNALEDTPYGRSWSALGQALPRPQAVLCISAHWMSHGVSLVQIGAQPETIHDFRGFPQALYDIQYPAPGAPTQAQQVVDLLGPDLGHATQDWGLDHGAWSVLKHLYPQANVPVFQLSVDMGRPFAELVDIGRQLRRLRDQGVLVVGSGNLVHNVKDRRADGGVWDWAEAFDALCTQWLEHRDFAAMAEANRLGSLMTKAHPTPDHFLPALYCVGMVEARDTLHFVTDGFDWGGISMRSFLFA